MEVNKTTCILYVPDGSKELYAEADQWKDFVNILEFVGPIVNPDIIVDKGAPDQVIDLKTIYNDAAIISYTVTSNTNEQVVIAILNGSELRFSFSKESAGISEILITAISNGKEIKATFKVEVKYPVGIQPLVDKLDMMIYPNPTRGELHINLTGITPIGTKLSVYNTSGKVIYKSLITSFGETINLQGNPPGVYFIKIGEKVNEIFKIVLY